jgi:hypothetical protein
MNPVYLGYAVVFLFEEDGSEWSVMVNESGYLVTQEPNIQYFQFDNWDMFRDVFPELSTEVKVVTIRKMNETFKMLEAV